MCVYIWDNIYTDTYMQSMLFRCKNFSSNIGLMVGICLFPRLPHKAPFLQLCLHSCGCAQDSCTWRGTFMRLTKWRCFRPKPRSCSSNTLSHQHTHTTVYRHSLQPRSQDCSGRSGNDTDKCPPDHISDFSTDLDRETSDNCFFHKNWHFPEKIQSFRFWQTTISPGKSILLEEKSSFL